VASWYITGSQRRENVRRKLTSNTHQAYLVAAAAAAASLVSMQETNDINRPSTHLADKGPSNRLTVND